MKMKTKIQKWKMEKENQEHNHTRSFFFSEQKPNTHEERKEKKREKREEGTDERDGGGGTCSSPVLLHMGHGVRIVILGEQLFFRSKMKTRIIYQTGQQVGHRIPSLLFRLTSKPLYKRKREMK